VTEEDGGIVQTTALQIRDGKICTVSVIRPPEKLDHLTARRREHTHFLT
jgi:RNA polymerase sigma-70 factor (ECF subfamily)